MKMTFLDLRWRTGRTAATLLWISATTQWVAAAAHFQIGDWSGGSRFVEGTNGLIYGFSGWMGTNDSGTIWTSDKQGSNRVLFTFSPDGFEGMNPSSLLAGSDGDWYGTTAQGGLGGRTNELGGVVFKLKVDLTGYTILHKFGDNPADGQVPVTLIEGTDGKLYGATQFGGAYTNSHDSGGGAVFRLNRDGTDYGILHHFGSVEADGARPTGKLLQGSDGILYGTTWLGGSHGVGTVFKLATDGSRYSILKHFESGCAGGYPWEGVIEGFDGFLYGNTGDWYCGGQGTLFRLKKDGTGYSVLQLYHLAKFHAGGLIQGKDGAIYGPGFRFWPPETPAISAVLNAQGIARITVAGVAGHQYRLLRSTHLQNWSVVTHFTMPAEGSYTHADEAQPVPAVFYHAAWIP